MMDDVISLTDVGVSDSLTPRLYGHVTSLCNASISDPRKRREREGERGRTEAFFVCASTKHFLSSRKFAFFHGEQHAHRRLSETPIKAW